MELSHLATTAARWPLVQETGLQGEKTPAMVALIRLDSVPAATARSPS